MALEKITANHIGILKKFTSNRKEEPMPKALFSTDQEWFEFIQRCRTSGMNDKEFCREHGISQTSLYRHIRMLKEKAYELPKNRKQKHEVVPLTVYDEATCAINDTHAEPKGHGICRGACHDGSRIHVSYGGFRLDIDEGADKSTLRDTLSILQKIC